MSDIYLAESKGDPTYFKLGKDDVWTVEDTVFTAVFPAGEEPDPGLVRQCREVDPHFVPVWCWKVYRTPAETVEKTGHMVISRYVPAGGDLDDTKPPIRLENVPKNFPFPSTRIFELMSWTIKWPKGSQGAKLGIPEPAKPFDKRVVDFLKADEAVRNNMSVNDLILLMQKWEENDEEELRKLVGEADYELKQHWKAMKKAVEEGNIMPGIYEPKPFVETAQKEFS